MREQIEPLKKSSTRQKFEQIGLSDKLAIVSQMAARIGARQVLKYHGKSQEELQTKWKAEAGMTPVTIADLKSEEDILKIISKIFPEHSINAEESGLTENKDGDGKDKLVWFVDPLDGTASFSREQKTSTVGLALYKDGQPVVSSICRPFQQELLVAEIGKGAYSFSLNGDLYIDEKDPKKLVIPEKENMENGIVYIDGVFTGRSFEPSQKLLAKIFEKSSGKYGLRAIGTNIGQQAEVAMGRGDLTVTTAIGGFYDVAAGSLVIKEAGGSFVDENGQEISEKSKAAIGGNKKFVEELLPYFKEYFKDYKGF